jgi:hypothetical protein
MKGVSGSLLALDILHALAVESQDRSRVQRARAVLARASAVVGPASAARTILDALVAPLAEQAGFRIESHGLGREIVGTLERGRSRAAVLAIGGWGSDLTRLAKLASSAEEQGPRWSVAVNGAALRIADRSRAYSRRVADFSLVDAEDDEAMLASLLRLLDCAEDGGLVTLEQCVAQSDRHRSAVSESLQTGVEEALVHLVAGFASRRKRRPPELEAALANALTIVFRVLFLLFAEARGLVPHWHPIYRKSYTIESLRPRIERSRRPPGVWHALQAISRLAHRGCRAGTLRVTPFNGRLFAPAAAPLAETLTIDDRRIRDMLLAITTRPGQDRRERISYSDLGVEQLGAVYERVLDYSPAIVDTSIILASSGRRKATGTFYTPRSMTEYLVRRTLAPLVKGLSAEAVLSLKVVDPAMGSGAFLVAACRYLADVYEQALVSEGTVESAEIDASDRAGFRRTIAQRCLYGVDRNPTAVQLTRLSLWLATLAADRPLTFLDHHLRCGNSLVGASPRDIMRQPPPGSGTRRRKPAAMPLFGDEDLSVALANVIPPRIRLATEADDTAEIVRRKERSLAALEMEAAPLARWRALADAWCAAWFWSSAVVGGAPVWSAISATIRGAPSGLPPTLERQWLDAIRRISGHERFFHWELEFPEAFFDAGGLPLEAAGFDAVLGNPPWDTLRTSASASAEDPTPRDLTRFSRDSGCYRLQSDGHANLYQLFTERALQLLRPGGRLGLLVPSGLFADHGCSRLRQALIDHCQIDGLLSFDNREAAFPIHRSVRFLLLTATSGRSTTDIPAVFGLHSPKVLEDVPDEGSIAGAVSLPISLIARFSGKSLAVPEVRDVRDRQILARIVGSVPALACTDGWNCRFGRELNATDDREHFGTAGLPVLEGKLLEPFHVNVAAAANWIARPVALRLLQGRADVDRPRLGYREVAASTNRLTLIAAIIPPATVTTHTIFCLKGAVDLDVQWFLCGMFNSFVANYLVRLRGGTHVPASAIAALPVPMPSRDSPAFHRIADLARRLAASRTDGDLHAELQARTAVIYGCDALELSHILESFPLVAREQREACAIAYRELTSR